MNSFPLAGIVAGLAADKLLEKVVGFLPERADSITDDSRRVSRGSLFVAFAGIARDGHEFVPAAAGAGATAFICEHEVPGGYPQIIVNDGRRAAAVAAAVAYDHPAKMLELVGVTGTNGKTTTVGILRHLLDDPATPSASIGTIGVLVGSAGRALPGGQDLTTPGPVELQRVLRELVGQGVRRVAMEISSHSLDQSRIEGLQFSVALFTNLTRDHLDYHQTMEKYREAKARLLQYLKPNGTAVINADDPSWDSLPITGHLLRFGIRNKADVTARTVVLTESGSRWELCVGANGYPVGLPVIGDVNVINALGAAAASLALGKAPGDIADRLGSIPQIPGRLEVIAREPVVVRDYAHTPDAMQRALQALRPIAKGRIICVFGCGGDRDRGKRPLMGRAAEELADFSIVTSDNPRSEPPDQIIDDIVAGMKSNKHERLEDRRAAIKRALELAESGDLIFLAGKGHETYQIRGAEKLPFDEKIIVGELLGADS